MNFRIGEKVVCINAKSANQNHLNCDSPLGKVVQNEIYTIFTIETDETIWLAFKEVDVNTIFEHHDFRKLDYQFVENLIKNLKEPVIV